MSTETPKPCYQSHKLVHALKITEVRAAGTDTTTDENPVVELTFEGGHSPKVVNLYGKPSPEAGWYMIFYSDGYTSFSPAEPFEEGNTRFTGFGFGDALRWLKEGKAVSRSGWNSGCQFVYLVPAASYPAMTDIAKAVYGADGLVPYEPYFAIKNARGTVNTWVPSIADALATDWTYTSTHFLQK